MALLTLLELCISCSLACVAECSKSTLGMPVLGNYWADCVKCCSRLKHTLCSHWSCGGCIAASIDGAWFYVRHRANISLVVLRGIAAGLNQASLQGQFLLSFCCGFASSISNHLLSSYQFIQNLNFKEGC